MKKQKSKPVKKKRSYSSGNVKLDRKILALIDEGKYHNSDLLSEMLQTCFKVTDENPDRGDVRLLNTTLKELRYAFKVFQPYRNIRKVAVFGSARTPRTSPDYKQAREFARCITKHKWMVITGASSGIMHAGNEGAGRENSFGVNIRLPFEQSANPVIAHDEKLINFKYFFTRKLIFIRESDATVLCPGGFGTHDEGYETMTLVQTGKTTPRPIICLDPPGSTYWSSWKKWIKEQLAKKGMVDPDDIHLMDFTHSAEEAARIVTDFYRNYHSIRYIRDLLVMRIRRTIPAKRLAKMNVKYKSILKHGQIQQHDSPFEEETNEPHDTHSLVRLSFYFNRRHFARLKMLIHEVNEY